MALLAWKILIQILCLKFVIEAAFIKKQRAITDMYYNDYSIFRNQGVSSVNTCVMMCYYNLNCVSFFYNTKEKWCQGHSVLFTKILTTNIQSSGTKYYSLSGEWCTMPGYINNRELRLCYKFYKSSDQIPAITSHLMAEEFCQARGEKFLTHLSRQQLNQVLRQQNVTDFTHVWIDGTDEGTDGTWYYSNGDLMTVFDWGPGEPEETYPADFYIIILKFADGRTGMSDAADNKHDFICSL